MEFKTIIQERYSVRKFKEDKIKEETLKELLDTINYVPTAKNNQPERVFVLQSKEALEKINKHARVYDAPLVLLIASNKDEAFYNEIEDYNSYEMDASIVSTYLMLKAWDLGLGSVWIRWFNADDVHKEFNLPENIRPVCLLALGYASDDSVPAPRHYEKKPLEEIVKIL